jgi:dTDP-4-amino-4,6-dideoxygalactose transaminase
VQGKECERFENAVATYCGVALGVAVTSGTAALHVALKALGVKAGDEVIVPAFTWVATAAMVEHCGAVPVFCEVELETFNLATEGLENLVTDRTVGIVPVHLFGLMAEMGGVMEFAGRHSLWVLEDAACALGSLFGEDAPGARGEAACFSFHPRKSITTGEGGMVVTKDKDLAERCRALRNHGISDDFTKVAEVGFNYRLTDFQAALGAEQMARFGAILEARRRIAARYDEALADLGWLTTPTEPDGCRHSYQSYVCLVETGRDSVASQLGEAGIMTRPGTHALPPMGCFAGRATGTYPNALRAAKASLAIPLFAGMTEAEQGRVIEALHACQPSS